MSRYHGGWAPYVSVAARRRKAEREMEKLRKKGAVVSPVKIEGRQIAKTFWGKAWCDNLESYRDYESRLPRGRTYVRNGSVVDLQIAPREVTAMVSGSEIYKVKVSIGDVSKARWKTLCADCSGGIDSLVELLQGRFSKGVMERICRQDTGLFPKPSEIRFTCGCLDHASMCKHVAAVLYGIGARLDHSPELLFRLRAVDETELLSDLGTALPDARTERDTAKTLVGDDLAALFGLDMAEDEPPSPSPPAEVASAALRKTSGKNAVMKPANAAAPLAAGKAQAMTPDQDNKAGLTPRRPKQTSPVSTETTAAKPTPQSTAASARPPPKKPTGVPTKSRSRPVTATPPIANPRSATKVALSARRGSSHATEIVPTVPVSKHQLPRRPARAAAHEAATSANLHRRQKDA
jgi:uncharacterized Zn finger protein